jgi:hypothetical protein
MKPKTTENKAKIFALYWNQRVIMNHSCPVKERVHSDQLFDVLESDYLELRPLSSITDEELLSISPELFNEENLAFVSLGIKKGSWIVKQYADELRLLGIALDWCGWSVEELVKEGVFVLK